MAKRIQNLLLTENPEGIESPFGVFTPDRIRWLGEKPTPIGNTNPKSG
ncbi:hypothetical protein M3O96_20445 [Aquiflexum sp. TKW24L]|nr:hypothetical protein [Aquiflexum sp. TKW24L]MCL6261481.1 hypothetical protein [Aquiflexum sp. TKW24L]